MRNSEKLIDLINKYEEYIKKGNLFLQNHFDIVKSPILAKREGKIPSSGELSFENQTFSFRFHGMGCRFEFGSVAVEFDYTFGDFIYKGFEITKLFWFIESYLDSDDEILKRETFDNVLLGLEKEGVITKIDETSFDTYDYLFTPDGLSL